MIINDDKNRLNLARREKLINKAARDCWWVKSFITGIIYGNKNQSKKR